MSREQVLNMIEDLIKIFGTRKQDTLIISEGISHVSGLYNTDSIIFSDTFRKEASKQNIENIIFSDSLLTSTAFRRFLTDLVPITDSISLHDYKTLQDLFSIAEIVKKGITISKDHVLVISEEKITDVNKNLIDTVPITELFATVYFIDLVEQFSITDSIFATGDIESLGRPTILLSSKNEAIIKTKDGKTILFTKFV